MAGVALSSGRRGFWAVAEREGWPRIVEARCKWLAAKMASIKAR